MRSMTIFVGSLEYSPIYKSHCYAFGKECEKAGYPVKYLFSQEYGWLISEEAKEKTIFVGNSTGILSMLKDAFSLRNKRLLREVFSKEKPTHVYLHNYHFLNHYVASLAKEFDATFIYHVHEPYVKNKKAHGGLHQYWLHLFEYFQERLLGKTDIAIVSSELASELFDQRYPDFAGKKMLIPLMYEDLGNSYSDVQDRKYVTFVGPLVPAKNPAKFLEIVRYSNDSNLDLTFLLISRSKIEDPKYFNEKSLEIFSRERISDQEFGELISRSVAVLTPYKRETQSSVILVSYMHGTPVVSSNVGGLPEFVSHKRTGYLLDVGVNAEEWIDGIRYVRENFARLSRNCRKYFLENFSERNWRKYLEALIVETEVDN